MNINEMSDNELTIAISKEVMGWIIKVRDFPRPGHDWLYDSNGGQEVMALYKFNPLTNPAHWWMVVERMRELGWNFLIANNLEGQPFGCILTKGDYPGDVRATAKDIGRAVCEAAVMAVRTEKGLEGLYQKLLDPIL